MGTSEINDDSRRANRPSDTELPSQLLQAKRWRELAEVLSDYEFADMKVAAGMTDELVADHRTAEAALPEGALSDEMVAVLRDWREFVCSESRRLALGHEPFVQVAYNHAESGAVVEAAERRLASYTEPWLRLVNRPGRGGQPAYRRTPQEQCDAGVCLNESMVTCEEADAGACEGIVVEPDSGRDGYLGGHKHRPAGIQTGIRELTYWQVGGDGCLPSE